MCRSGEHFASTATVSRRPAYATVAAAAPVAGASCENAHANRLFLFSHWGANEVITEGVRFLLRNFPAVLFAIALIMTTVRRHSGSGAERHLSWILLLPIGATGPWSGLFHVFFPAAAAAYTGWQVSPFQFEVGMGRPRHRCDRVYSLLGRPRI
jgi:hypothetical protein